MNLRRFISSLDQWDRRNPLSVIGPTGCGKTSILCAWIRTHYPQDLKHPLLVSVDAVAVYRQLDIGSAKPLHADRSDFDWAGLDLFSPEESANAASFVNQAFPAATHAYKASRPVVFVGGSMFYERALVEGMAPGSASDPEFTSTLQTFTNQQLYDQLLLNDRRWTDKVHLNDRYRLERFSDLVQRQGLSYSDLFSSQASSDRPWKQVDTLVLGLELEAPDLKPRLASRIEQMLQSGWISEVRELIKAYGPDAPALQSVGYREVLQALKENPEAPDLRTLSGSILQSHLQLAKKQRTWLRGLLRRLESQG